MNIYNQSQPFTIAPHRAPGFVRREARVEPARAHDRRRLPEFVTAVEPTLYHSRGRSEPITLRTSFIRLRTNQSQIEHACVLFPQPTRTQGDGASTFGITPPTHLSQQRLRLQNVSDHVPSRALHDEGQASSSHSTWTLRPPASEPAGCGQLVP